MRHLGKRDHVPDERDLRLENYAVALPRPPSKFGHALVMPADGWGVLGNDSVGDCVVASGMHSTMLYSRVGSGPPADFTAQEAITTYSRVGGYVPGDPNTDNGLQIRDLLKYRAKTGLADANGYRHTITAYVTVNPRNLSLVKAALWLFGSLEMGVQWPQSAFDQFDRGKTLTYKPSSPNAGGHCVPLVGHPTATHWQILTWGRLAVCTTGFLQYVDELWAPLTPEILLRASARTDEGFNWDQLQADLAAVRS